MLNLSFVLSHQVFPLMSKTAFWSSQLSCFCITKQDGKNIKPGMKERCNVSLSVMWVCLNRRIKSHLISVLFRIIQGIIIFSLSSATSHSSSTWKAKIRIFFGKTKEMGMFHQSNYFLSLPNIQVHRVIHALYQKHRSRDSILLALGEGLHKSSQPSKIREYSDECVFCFFGGVFFLPLSLCIWSMNTEHQGKILLSPLQNVKLKSNWGYTGVQLW